MRFLLTIVAAVFLCVTSAQAQISTAAQRVIANAQQECGGSFKILPNAVLAIDLDGDKKNDEIVNFGEFECEGTGAFWCGSGGCRHAFIVGDAVEELQVRDWTVVDWRGTPVILLGLHGSACNGYGAQLCISSMFFAEGKFRDSSQGGGY